MNPELLAAIVAIVALLGQALNVVLFLRIRVAQLESEKRVLEKVDEKYVLKEVYRAHA